MILSKRIYLGNVIIITHIHVTFLCLINCIVGIYPYFILWEYTHEMHTIVNNVVGNAQKWKCTHPGPIMSTKKNLHTVTHNAKSLSQKCQISVLVWNCFFLLRKNYLRLKKNFGVDKFSIY